MQAAFRARPLLALLAGAFAALGQAPFGLWPLALAGFALGLWAVSQARRPGRIAWLFGASHFAVALHWIVEPFLVEPDLTGWLAPFGLVGLAGGLALFWALAGWGAARLAPRNIWVLGLCLLGAEHARGLVLTGFPWAQPGHIWIDTALVQTASLWGPLGLSLITVVIGCACATLKRGPVLAALGGGAALFALGIALKAPTHYAEDAPVVRLVQPNAPQHLKWRPDWVPVFFERGLQATAAPPTGKAPHLILWPETSLPEILNRSVQSRAVISEAAGNTPVLLGAQRFDEAGRPRNVAVLLDQTGEVAALQDKHHLVPFGEYLPLPGLFARLGVGGLAANLAGTYAAGAGPALINVPGLGPVLPLICYEAIFPAYVRSTERPRVIAHLTNDAWFGTFAGPQQHLNLARLRAVESGLPLVRAANTGVSAVIDPQGRILSSLGLGASGPLDVALPEDRGPTLYARTGDWPILLLLVLIFAQRLQNARRFPH